MAMKELFKKCLLLFLFATHPRGVTARLTLKQLHAEKEDNARRHLHDEKPMRSKGEVDVGSIVTRNLDDVGNETCQQFKYTETATFPLPIRPDTIEFDVPFLGSIDFPILIEIVASGDFLTLAEESVQIIGETGPLVTITPSTSDCSPSYRRVTVTHWDFEQWIADGVVEFFVDAGPGMSHDSVCGESSVQITMTNLCGACQPFTLGWREYIQFPIQLQTINLMGALPGTDVVTMEVEAVGDFDFSLMESVEIVAEDGTPLVTVGPSGSQCAPATGGTVIDSEQFDSWLADDSVATFFMDVGPMVSEGVCTSHAYVDIVVQNTCEGSPPTQAPSYGCQRLSEQVNVLDGPSVVPVAIAGANPASWDVVVQMDLMGDFNSIDEYASLLDEGGNFLFNQFQTDQCALTTTPRAIMPASDFNTYNADGVVVFILEIGANVDAFCWPMDYVNVTLEVNCPPPEPTPVPTIAPTYMPTIAPTTAAPTATPTTTDPGGCRVFRERVHVLAGPSSVPFSFTVPNPATLDVVLHMDLFGDFDSANEYATLLDEGGNFLLDQFQTDQCVFSTAPRAVIPASDFNTYIADGTANFTLEFGSEVDELCSRNYVDITMEVNCPPPEGDELVYGLQPNCFVDDPSRYDICLDFSDPSGTVQHWMEAFVGARQRWESIIIGDTGPRVDPPYDSNFFVGTEPPPFIDDLYIASSVTPIDGPGGILAYAGVALFRGSASGVQSYSGLMVFDEFDTGGMIADGTWEAVILHEMGHVVGVGTLWDDNGLHSGDRTDSNYTGVNAQAEWYGLGCTGGLPVETDGGSGTAGSHWDEHCLDEELMTGYLGISTSPHRPLSRITIASLEDMGYAVNYTSADPYGLGDIASGCPFCSAATGITKKGASDKARGSARPELSPAGEEAILEAAQDFFATHFSSNDSNVVGKLSILYKEGEEIFHRTYSLKTLQAMDHAGQGSNTDTGN